MGSSVFIAILFHGVFNFITASEAGEGIVAAVISTFARLKVISIKANVPNEVNISDVGKSSR